MKRNFIAFTLMAAFLLATSFHCKNKQEANVPPTENAVSGSSPYDFSFSFSPNLPGDLNPDADQYELSEFAWNEFFALNWKSSYAEDGKRDNPDLGWKYSADSDQNPALVVWETYAHRAEYRPAAGNLTPKGKPQPFDDPPHYAFKNPGNLQALDGASFELFNNLDENSEIGSCFLFHEQEDNENLVRYQAKCNRVQYDYVRNVLGSDAAVDSARKKAQDNIVNTQTICDGKHNSCDCKSPSEVFVFPCGGEGSDGAVEIKTAWRKYLPGDDTSRYFTRDVIYYVQESSVGGKVFYGNEKFLLLGIHIIRKTQNFQNFIFATFEHVDLVDHFGYVLDHSGKTGDTFYKPYPRLSPLPTQGAIAATQSAHEALLKRQPDSKLQYYSLVGVQGNPKLISVQMEGKDTLIADSTIPAFFLANYVIESDSTLGRFHGSGIGKPFNQGANQLYQGHWISGGGCQGCHGVAQRGGADFSFISLSTSFFPEASINYDDISDSKLKKLKALLD